MMPSYLPQPEPFKQVQESELDLRLVKHVLEELADDPRLDTSNIHVNASSGTIILTGSVSSESQRLAVEREAWWVDTVRAVDNRLVVDMQRGGPRAELVPESHESTNDPVTTDD